MSSNADSDAPPFDLRRDVPTTPEDSKVLGDLRRSVPGWLRLSAAEIEALLPPGALERRPPMRANPTPFQLD